MALLSKLTTVSVVIKLFRRCLKHFLFLVKLVLTSSVIYLLVASLNKLHLSGGPACKNLANASPIILSSLS